MKIRNYLLLLCSAGLFSCKKTIDLYPESNLNTGTYYSNYEEVKAALTGAYNNMQKPLNYEWELTELRSDNSKMGSPGSTASNNRDLSDLDMFIPSTTQTAIYQYWLSSYNTIRNANIILEKLGVTYDPAAGALTYNSIDLPIEDADRKQLAGEAMFIRAYNYFNLVRLYGGVFLIYQSVTPDDAKKLERSSVADIYKLIEADLKTAAGSMNTLKFSQMAPADLGRANHWAAEGLLAKAYLTLNRKTEAATLLQDVITNSGYHLQPTYAKVFDITNEMNDEILFAVRFKAGGLGLGSPFGNTFAPLGTGSTIINGDGDGLNYPTADLDTATNDDLRKPNILKVTGDKWYVTKYLFPVTTADDGESDWPVLRYPDILMMLAEAQGYSQSSLDLINAVRPRAGLASYTTATVTNVAQFEQALSNERRIEFAFEDQRWFDLVRFNTTLTTITAQQVIKDHYADEYFTHYRSYLPPTPTLAQLQSWITADKLLLPIPQHEIDTNTQLKITQNPGY